jgi:diguanylate cyclase (GGDEF)-like protein
VFQRTIHRFVAYSLWTGLLLAQLSSCLASSPQYIFRAYRQPEGLDNLSVTAVAFDRQGFLWVGTQNGLYRFLGSTFQRFGTAEGINEPVIEDVLATPDGMIWAGTLQNLYRWTGERFVPAAPNPIHVWRNGRLASETPGSLLIADNTSHLFRLKYRPDGSFLSVSPVFPGQFKSLGSMTVQNGNLWIGCDNRICEFEAASSLPTSKKEWGQAEGVPDEYCYSLRFDPRGSLWVATEHHVLELPSGSPRFVDRTPPNLVNTGIYHRQPVAIDSQGRVLVSVGKQLARWQGSSWLMLGPSNGLASIHIDAMAFDSNGDLWLGTAGQGLNQWAGYRTWEGWSETQGLPASSIWSLGLFTGGKAYVGTETGPAAVDLAGGTVERLFSSSEWPYGQVGGIVQDHSGTLWAGTKTGAILRFDPSHRHPLLRATIPNVILKMSLDPSGRVLVLSKKGMYSFDPTAPKVRVEPVEAADKLLGSPQRMASACQAPDGAMSFAGTRGVVQLRGNDWSLLPIHAPPVDDQSARQPNWSDLACAPDGSFWLLSRDFAIWHLIPRDNRFEAVPLKLPAQFSSVGAVAILADRHNWLWLGTDAGVFAWNGSAWCHLTQENGLIWNDVNTAGLAEAPDGSIWIGTSGGLSHLALPQTIFSEAPLPISLIDVRRGGQQLPLASGFSIPWASYELSFRFASPSSLNRSDLRYRYRIPQIQSSWFETRDSLAQFVTLPPGSFTFEVQAFNPGSGLVSPVLSRNFRIAPPWWRTPWFYALGILVFTLCLVAFYHLRTRHLLNQRRKLEALVRERTVELEVSRECLRIQATRDSLTQLPNRGEILSTLDREMASALRQNTSLAVVLADIDHFKAINDTFGHLAGDTALRCFASALSACLPFPSIAGRYGGEEFLVLLPGISASCLDQTLTSLHRAISNLTIRHQETEFHINCSVGAVSFSPSQDAGHILAAADHALYQAKRSGRNRVVHHSVPTGTAA